MFDFKDATTWDREVMLAWLLYRMSHETRQAMMRELPGAYNRLCGRAVVSTIINGYYAPQSIAAGDKEAAP